MPPSAVRPGRALRPWALRDWGCGLSAASISILLMRNQMRELLPRRGLAPLPCPAVGAMSPQMLEARKSPRLSASSSVPDSVVGCVTLAPSRPGSCTDRPRALPVSPWYPPGRPPTGCAPPESAPACCPFVGTRCTSAAECAFGVGFPGQSAASRRRSNLPLRSHGSWPSPIKGLPGRSSRRVP